MTQRVTQAESWDESPSHEGEGAERKARRGYYHHPSVFQDRVVFVSEDDLWLVWTTGGEAIRLTALRAAPSRPRFSPDGSTVFFTGLEEGSQDLYAIRAKGGDVRRLTHLGCSTFVAGFLLDGRVVVATDARSPFLRMHRLFAVNPEGGEPEALPYGRATDLSFGPSGQVAVGRRNLREFAYWKRYDGGTAGQIWVDPTGSGTFRHFDTLAGDQESPMWVGDRLFFLSAHESVGHLYSVRSDLTDLRRHSPSSVYYARNASSDGRSVVYHSGGDLYILESGASSSRRLDFAWHPMARERSRRFISASRYLQGYALSPKGESLGLVTRGKPFVLGNWEGPVLQVGEVQGTGYRLARFLPDGERVAVISDRTGEESLEIHSLLGPHAQPDTYATGQIGRAYELTVSPRGDRIALTNHRMEVVLVDLPSGQYRVADRSMHGRVRHLAWSPDGRYLAYSWPETLRTRAIRVLSLETGEAVTVTRPVLRDYAPEFDPKGRYLYFLSARVYNPVYDDLQFSLGFPGGERPYLVTLKHTTENPFLAKPRPLVEEPEPKGRERAQAESPASPDAQEHLQGSPGDSDVSLNIDFEGITDRVLAFPVPEGHYGQLLALDDKVLFTRFRVQGVLSPPERLNEPTGELWAYDLREGKAKFLVGSLTSCALSADRRTLAYASSERLRVVRAGDRVEAAVGGNGNRQGNGSSEPGRTSGWVDLGRVKVSVDPPAEWGQMLREAWRNMRDHFWTEDMSGVDWPRVYELYSRLLPRIASREELWDLMWEMQGELGTSHAYVRPAEGPDAPSYPGGSLGADFVWDPEREGYRIVHIVEGTAWSETEDSPLHAPGVGVTVGDVLKAVNGIRLGPRLTPGAVLVNLAQADVALTVTGESGERTVTVHTLRDETAARYREWVEKSRAYVHSRTNGQVGYVHVPNMMGLGFAEFHRGFLTEAQREALVVDVRFNGGGHVSQLLIERLRRRIIGYQTPRWGVAASYPAEAVSGPIVCLTNEHAGSDGDIFSQAFKTYGIGPLVGTRTWGGVIGISGERSLVDRTVTTQPEFSFWFEGPGWGVENHGVDPDILVEDPPENGGEGRDAQLERAVQETLRLLSEHPPVRPDLSEGRPRRTLPPVQEHGSSADLS